MGLVMIRDGIKPADLLDDSLVYLIPLALTAAFVLFRFRFDPAKKSNYLRILINFTWLLSFAFVFQAIARLLPLLKAGEAGAIGNLTSDAVLSPFYTLIFNTLILIPLFAQES